MRTPTVLSNMFRRTARIATVLAAVCLPATAAMAQAAPQPAINPPRAWVGFIMMFLMLAVVVAINLMPSKRGHQD